MSSHVEATIWHDMHCQLDFLANPGAIARELASLGVDALSATVTPDGFERAGRSFAGATNVRVGVGLHPWWVADGTCGPGDVARAAELAAARRYVAEVGLDFAHGRDASADAQVAALDAILAACEGGGHVLSIHAVRSAGAVLDLLEAHGTCANNDAILHWFSGTGNELARARKMGCLFSVGPRMLATRRGREYAHQIPVGRLLLETDLPGSPEEGATLSPTAIAEGLRGALDVIAKLHGEDAPPEIARHSARLLGL